MTTRSIGDLSTLLAAALLSALPGSAQVVNNNYYLTGNYIAVLGRMPDPAGWIYWMGGLTGVNPSTNVPLVTQPQLTSAFLTSAEYCGDMGTCTPTAQAFLTALYQKALNRVPAQAELTYWENSMNAGTTPAQVVSDFIASPEFATDHGSASPPPNAATYCTGYENGIAFDPGASGATGTETQFTVTYTNYCGNTDLASGAILIDAAPSAGASPTGGCSVEWDPSGNVTLYGASTVGAGIPEGGRNSDHSRSGLLRVHHRPEQFVADPTSAGQPPGDSDYAGHHLPDSV